MLLLLRSLEPGGTERQVLTLANGLRARGYEVSVAVLHSGGTLEAEAEERLGPLIRLDLGRRAPRAWTFLRAVRQRRPDILYSFLPGQNLLSLLTRLQRRRPRIVWGIRSAGMDLSSYNVVGRLAYRLEPHLAGLADAVVVNSKAAKRVAKESGFPEERLHEIQNGIDTDHFSRDDTAGAAYRQKLGVSDRHPLVGLVARIDLGKGHATFIRAAAIVRRARPDTTFVCIGGGSPALETELRSLADRVGVGDAMKWTGHEHDIVAAYSALDLACSASDYESFPNAVAEAMACGARVVVTDVGDSSHIVGDTGYVVPSANAAALADAVLAALLAGSDAKRRVTERIVRHFSVEAMVDRSDRLFDDLLAS